MKRPISLARTPGILALVRRAEIHTIAEQPDSAHVHMKTAMLAIAELLGVDERGRELMADLVIRAGEREDDYEAGMLDGRVRDDRAELHEGAGELSVFDGRRDLRTGVAP